MGMIKQNYNAVHGINAKAESKQFAYKTTDGNKHYVWIQRLFHLGRSGMETQVFLEYLSQCVFRSDNSERINLQNFTSGFLDHWWKKLILQWQPTLLITGFHIAMNDLKNLFLRSLEWPLPTKVFPFHEMFHLSPNLYMAETAVLQVWNTEVLSYPKRWQWKLGK